MRYLLETPDDPTFTRVMKLLQSHHVPVFLELRQRGVLSSGDMSIELKDELERQNVRVSHDEQFEPDHAIIESY